MNIGAILLSAWMTFGWFPRGILLTYDPLDETYINGAFYTELGAEAQWRSLFFEAQIMTPMTAHPSTGTFTPTQAEYLVGAGLDLDGLTFGWRHVCYHPVIVQPMGWMISNHQLVPPWEGAYDVIYLTIGRRR